MPLATVSKHAPDLGGRHAAGDAQPAPGVCERGASTPAYALCPGLLVAAPRCLETGDANLDTDDAILETGDTSLDAGPSDLDTGLVCPGGCTPSTRTTMCTCLLADGGVLGDGT